MKVLTTSSAGLLMVSLVATALAQRPIDDRARVQTTRDALQARDQRQETTAGLSAWLNLANHSQVELGELALAKSQQPEVRKFAQAMVDDHTQMWKSLQKFVPEQQGDDRNDTGTAAEQREIAAQNNNTMMQVGRTAAAYKLRLTKQLLERYQGQDFNMGYLGQQMVAHVEMLATLEAMKNHGTDEFQQIVAGGIEKTRQHLQQAAILSRKLEDDRVNTARGNSQERIGRDTIDRNPLDTTPRPQTDRNPLDPDTSPRPKIDLGQPDAPSDINPRPSIKTPDDLDDRSDLDITP